MMTPSDMRSIAMAYLSRQLDCDPSLPEEKGVFFVPNTRQPAPFWQATAVGDAVIVSVSPALLSRAQALLEGKSRDEIFECPFVYGQSLYHLPAMQPFDPPLDPHYALRLLEGDDIRSLWRAGDFANAVSFDACGQTDAAIALCALYEGRVVAVAAASPHEPQLWETGVDVLPIHRHRGLGAALTARLSSLLLERGIVPLYCASTTNLASLNTARRAGLSPCWVSTYRTILDHSSVYDALLRTQLL